MLTQFTATVVDGMLRPDKPLDLPNDSRVSVVIEPVVATPQPNDAQATLEVMLKYADQHRMGSGGRRYSRDELYERD